MLDDGLHMLPLDIGGVGLLSATLDDKPVAIGRAADGQLNLLVSGEGPHRLALDMVAPLEMTSAQQVLAFRLANAAVGKWRLTVPGDVEIKSGADVVSRTLDKSANATRFELLPRGGDTAIRMSLNSHLQRRDEAVASRCVIFDEVTEAYERLHATMTFWILHRAVDRLSFFVPDGFEVTQIDSPLLARWDVASEGGRRVVNVRLREPTSDTVALSVAAIKTPGQLKAWHLPRLEVRDVVSQVTVLGLVVQSDLKTESLAAENLIAIDTAALAGALPASLARQESDALPRTFIAAYYAPQAAYDLKADFTRPPATLSVTTHLLLNIQEQGCEVQGGFRLTPATEKRFAFDFNVPAGWNVTEVSGAGDVPLTIERFTKVEQSGRVHVKLPQGVAPGQSYPVEFRAIYTPPGWMNHWKSQSLEFPMFSVIGAASDEGALAVIAGDDFEVRADKLDRLVPIVDEEKARFGLSNSATALAYRYDSRGAMATLLVDRMQSRVTARTFSFFKFNAQGLAANYEVIYTIEGGKVRRLSLLLPDSTPEKLKIRGLDGVNVKDPVSEHVGEMRRWNVSLDEARRGTVRLAVEFQLPPEALMGPPLLGKQKYELPKRDANGKTNLAYDFVLPLVKADGVAYQSGLAAVEGDAELDVQVKTDARRADLGPRADAVYQPGRRLLATYGFAGDLPSIKVDIARNPSYALTPAIIESAVLKSLLSADGDCQTQANFGLRTKAVYLEVVLPNDATLWSAVLDGVPLKPQKKDSNRLLSLPPGAAGRSRSLQLVYEVAGLLHHGQMQLGAPQLCYRAGDASQLTKIPLVNVQWNVTAPAGYEVASADGTLEARQIARPTPAPLVVAESLYALGGGYIGPTFPLVAAARESAQRITTQDNLKQEGVAYSDYSSSWGVDVKSRSVGETGQAAAHGAVAGLKPNAAGVGNTTTLINGGLYVPSQPSPPAQDMPNSTAVNGTALGLAGALPPSATPAPSAPPSATVTVNGGPTIINALSPSVPAPAPEAKPDAARPAEPAPAEIVTTFGSVSGKPSGDSAGKPVYHNSKLLGNRSLKIDIQQAGSGGWQKFRESPAKEQVLTFTSLGADPNITLALADRNRLDALSWAAGLIAFLAGIAITARPVRMKVFFLLVVGLASALLPLAWDNLTVAVLCNAVFYAASLLVPYYLAAGVVRWMAKKVTNVGNRWLGRAAAATAIVLALSMGCAMPARAADWGLSQFSQPQTTLLAQDDQPAAKMGLSPSGPTPEPVRVPDDALIVPYDVKSETGIEKADHLMVPYDRYVELWNRAYPDKKIEAHPAPLPYTLSGASYSATLEGEETLNIAGQMQINVSADSYVSIPLGLRGGVLAKAMLDGKPAQMKIVSTQAGQVEQSKIGEPAPRMDSELFLLQLTGKGPHKLEIEIRLKLARTGGWRGAAGAAQRARHDRDLPRAKAEDGGPPRPLRRSPQPRDSTAGRDDRNGPRPRWSPASPMAAEGGRGPGRPRLDRRIHWALGHRRRRTPHGRQPQARIRPQPARRFHPGPAGRIPRGKSRGRQRPRLGCPPRRRPTDGRGQPVEDSQGQRTDQPFPGPQRAGRRRALGFVHRSQRDRPRRGADQRADRDSPQRVVGRANGGAQRRQPRGSWPAARFERRPGHRGKRADNASL